MEERKLARRSFTEAVITTIAEARGSGSSLPSPVVASKDQRFVSQ